MIDFEISPYELSQAINVLTAARETMKSDLVDLSAYKGNVKWVVTGREYTSPAVVSATGSAHMLISTIDRLADIFPTFDTPKIRIRIEPGRLRLNSMSISSPRIALKAMGDRPIDFPDDAPLIDTLSLQYLFSSEELAASNLVGRWAAARSRYLKLLDSAAESLAPLGINTEQLEKLTVGSIKENAERLRPMLKPSMPPGRAN